MGMDFDANLEQYIRSARLRGAMLTSSSNMSLVTKRVLHSTAYGDSWKSTLKTGQLAQVGISLKTPDISLSAVFEGKPHAWTSTLSRLGVTGNGRLSAGQAALSFFGVATRSNRRSIPPPRPPRARRERGSGLFDAPSASSSPAAARIGSVGDGARSLSSRDALLRAESRRPRAVAGCFSALRGTGARPAAREKENRHADCKSPGSESRDGLRTLGRTFSWFLIEGPFVGDRLRASSGEAPAAVAIADNEVNEAQGVISPAEAGCQPPAVGTHFPGSMYGMPDPNPTGCGWGRVVRNDERSVEALSRAIREEVEAGSTPEVRSMMRRDDLPPEGLRRGGGGFAPA